LEKNLFIEYLLPLRNVPADVMEIYRHHYRIPGPTRQPMLSWTRDLPIAGEPEDVVRIVDSYAQWLSTSPIPKLFIDAEPAGFLIGAQREFCRSWPNQTIVSVEGSHFLHEDSPDAVGATTAHCFPGTGRTDCLSSMTTDLRYLELLEPTECLRNPRYIFG
jgi:haloalkane dehalogenase